ncbi:MAG: leucyl/phenylalanyl-tRNA--protein transferase [Rhodothermales bacterium]
MEPVPPLTPELLVYAYQQGVFPMAESAEGPIYWYAPDPRGILPLDEFRVSKNLRKLVRKDAFTVRTNTAFEAVMRACAEREETWISDEIVAAYVGLHELGAAHSIECWQDEQLVGGLYGVALGGAFFGESMFHRMRDASKVALVHLVARLKAGGYTLLDTQFTTPHLEQFGATAIRREVYEARLDDALTMNAQWYVAYNPLDY